ncbi:MAG: cell surface protein, partial [Prevotellaceae bacterium]|nr:cell surface protein [Prevotellaceae bacterium]
SIYVSIYTEDAYTWSWATLDELKEIDSTIDSKATELPYSTTLTYGEDNSDNLNIKYILGTSLKDSRYNAIGLVYELDSDYTGPYENSIALDDDAHPQATLTTNENGLDEYFDVSIDSSTGDITFTQKSEDTNPMGDVPSTLTINCVDSYGHPVVITLPMTVAKR